MPLQHKCKEVNRMFLGYLIKHYVTVETVDSDYWSYVQGYQANIGLSQFVIPYHVINVQMNLFSCLYPSTSHVSTAEGH